MPLYEFLKQNNVITTHFMIGSNILWNADAFTYALETLESESLVRRCGVDVDRVFSHRRYCGPHLDAPVHDHAEQ